MIISRQNQLLFEIKKIAIFFIFLSANIGCSEKIQNHNFCKINGDNMIAVVNHGWHSGIIVSRDEVLSEIPELKRYFLSDNYLEFGWGDQDYYQSEKFSLPIAFKALFYPTRSVLHVSSITHVPNEFYDPVNFITIGISAEHLRRLLLFIRAQFEFDSANKVIDLGKGLSTKSRFFQAQGNYYFAENCNSWVMMALVQAGIKQPFWPVFTSSGPISQVMRQCRETKSL